MIDPCCRHDNQCENCTRVISRNGSGESVTEVGEYRAYDLVGRNYLDEVTENQLKDEENLVRFCCNQIPERSRLGNHHYSLAVIERDEGDATDFLAKYNKWTDEDLERARLVPNEFRRCCFHCREAYGLYLFLKDESPVECDTVEDLLQGPKSLRLTRGWRGFFSPSFYSGGAFDSSKVREFARSNLKAEGLLRSQSLLEKFRYVTKHGGSAEGYMQRFTHGYDLKKVFHDAAELILPGSSRPPVGLNPERFIAMCQSCRGWLHGYEFGTELCDDCAELKPAAKKKG